MVNLGSELHGGLEPLGTDLVVDSDLLLDHALVLGATGSGKTTFGLHLIDQALEQGCPVLVLDTTGDISSSLMEHRGAPLFRGFEDDPTPTDPRVQLNAIDLSAAAGMFHRPSAGAAGDELWIEETEALIRALLDVLGYRTRGLTPEFMLLHELVIRAWGDGQDLSLEDLVPRVLVPGLRKLGLFEIETAMPSTRRADLAAAIQSLMVGAGATPSLTVDLPALLSQPDGSPAVNVISFAQRSLDVRRFLAAMVIAKLSTFVQYRSSDEHFSLLVYVDEGPTFLPPHQRVTTTGPFMSMLDGWRRHGVGVAIVAEQPEDLYEDVLDLCELWIVGGMPVARSRASVVAELDLVNPPIDETALDGALKHLSAGQFVLRSPRLDTLRYFQLAR